MKEEIINCLSETRKHVRSVQKNINIFVHDLIERGCKHDNSKFEEPELSGFAKTTPKLGETEYNSPEYKELLQELRPILDHHYSKNRHHPEHFPNGIEDMTLIDILEMLADWKAATERNKNGNIRTSIEHNAERFNINPQLIKILQNTVREYFTE